MKRLHIHVGVEDLAHSIRFYSALFGAEPVKTKPDYAKWMLESPHVNFAISTRAGETGVNHLGIQVDDESELAELRDRLKKADMDVQDEGETVCCYAKSEKSWVQDPAGIPWEAYRTMEDAEIFKTEKTASAEASGCCAPAKKRQRAAAADNVGSIEDTDPLHGKFLPLDHGGRGAEPSGAGAYHGIQRWQQACGLCASQKP